MSTFEPARTRTDSLALKRSSVVAVIVNGTVSSMSDSEKLKSLPCEISPVLRSNVGRKITSVPRTTAMNNYRDMSTSAPEKPNLSVTENMILL